MKDYPLIKFVLLFIIGIVIEKLTRIDSTHLIIISLSILFIYTLSVFILSERYLVIKQGIAVIGILTLGSFYFSAMAGGGCSYPFDDPKISTTVLFGKIQSIELLRNEKLSLNLLVDSTITKEFKSSKRYSTLVNVYDSKRRVASLSNILLPGNTIKIIGTLMEPKNQRNPGEFDYRKYLNRKGISATFSSYKAANVELVDRSNNIFKSIIHKSRKSIDKKISSLYDPQTRGLLRGLLLADRSQIDYSDRQNFVNAGVVHILAVSGLHVGYIILIFLFLFTRLNIYLRYLFTALGLLLFLFITNLPPSVFRAVVMSLVLIIALVTNRSYNGYNALAFAALIILLFNPNELFNSGFQLSFTAVLSILYFYPVFQKLVSGLELKSQPLRWLLLFVSVSLAAQIGTLPITVIYFRKLSVAALFANLIVIPLVGIIVGLGILTITLSYFWFWFAAVYSEVTKVCSDFLFWFVNRIGEVKHSYVYINHFSNYDLLLYFIALILLIILLKKATSIKTRIVFFLLIGFNYFVYASLDNTHILSENKLSIVGIDVGQGDSFLVKFPNNEVALIDAGNATPNYDNGERTIYPLLKYLDIDTIDYAFISHVDSDHYAGFLSLFDRGIIKKVYKPAVDTSLKKDVELESILRKDKIPTSYYDRSILSIGNTRLYVFNDTANAVYYRASTNDKSGFMKLVYGGSSFLFTGDASVKVEKYYVNKYGEFLKSDLLKVGHHGSKSSTSDIFLRVVSPKYTLISAGIKNKFKHPSKEVLKKLVSSNIKISRTDVEGAVMYQSDGTSIKRINWKKQESAFNLE